jgi:hypothetical protein
MGEKKELGLFHYSKVFAPIMNWTVLFKKRFVFLRCWDSKPGPCVYEANTG